VPCRDDVDFDRVAELLRDVEAREADEKGQRTVPTFLLNTFSPAKVRIIEIFC
jgi:hypothetical protein